MICRSVAGSRGGLDTQELLAPSESFFFNCVSWDFLGQETEINTCIYRSLLQVSGISKAHAMTFSSCDLEDWT